MVSVVEVITVSKQDLKISLERSGGFIGIPVTVEVSTDALPQAAATELRQLVENAELDACGTDEARPGRPDRFVYRLRIEHGGQPHELWLSEDDLDATTRPLIDWLTALATSSRPSGESGESIHEH